MSLTGSAKNAAPQPFKAWPITSAATRRVNAKSAGGVHAICLAEGGHRPEERETMKVKVGSLMYLKSGGPVMTVVEITEYKDYTDCNCVWFSEEGGVAGGTFPAKALIKVEAIPQEQKMGFV